MIHLIAVAHWHLALHMKHRLGIRDQKGWNRCSEWGPGTKVGVPEKGKIKKKTSKAF